MTGPPGGAATLEVVLASGLTCRVVRAGPGGQAPDLVLLHGINSLEEDDEVLAGLSGRWNVWAPVAPGFADLDELDEIADVHDLAIHYEEVLGALGIDRAVVVGHSFGGMVAAELAAHYPSRVSKLVLIAPLGLWDDDEPVADLFGVGVTELADLLWADPAGPAALAGVTRQGDGGPSTSEATEALISMAQGFSAVAKFVWPIPDKGLRRRLRRISAPVLLVWGAKDRVVPVSYASQFEAGLADAKVTIVEGAGHMLPKEASAQLIGLVEAFLR